LIKPGVGYDGELWAHSPETCTGGAKAKLNATSTTSSGFVVFTQDNASYTTYLKGFDVDGNGYNTHAVVNVCQPGTADCDNGLIQVLNNEVHECEDTSLGAGYCIKVGATNAKTTENVQVMYNEVWNDGTVLGNELIAVYEAYQDNGGDSVINNVLVRGNVMYGANDNANCCMAKNNANNIIFEFNTAYDCENAGFNDHDDGVAWPGPNNITYRYNIAYGNGKGAYKSQAAQSDGPRQVYLYGNLFFENNFTGGTGGACIYFEGTVGPTTAYIYNNTCYSNAAGEIIIPDASVTAYIRNNVLYAESADYALDAVGGTIAQHTNNVYYGSSGDLIRYGVTGYNSSEVIGSFESSASVSNPNFKNSSNQPTGFSGTYGSYEPNNDGFLVSGSPCVDSAVDLGSSYNGSINSVTRSGTWDRGAYEAGEETPNHVQEDFQGYSDNGVPGVATAKAIISTNWVQASDEQFRIRFAVAETNSQSALNEQYTFEYSYNGGTWTAITGSSSYIQIATSSYYTDEDSDNVKRVYTGILDFTGGVLDDDGTAGENNQIDFTTGDEVWEIESCFTIVSEDVSGNDSISVRIAGIDSWANTPVITVSPQSNPTVSVIATDSEADEGDSYDQGLFTIYCAPDCSGQSINFNWTSGTATLDTDFTASDGSPIVINGATDTITVYPINDSNPGEGNENITITITSGTGYSIGTSSATVTLIESKELPFSEDFEVHTTTPFGFGTVQTQGTNSAVTIYSGANKNGNYAVQLVCDDDSSPGYARLKWSLTYPATEFWEMFDVWIDSGWTPTDRDNFLSRVNESDVAMAFGVGYNGSQYYWAMTNNNGNKQTTSGGTVVEDTHYVVCFRYVQGTGADSISQAWIKTYGGEWSSEPDMEITTGTATQPVYMGKIGPHQGNNDGDWTVQIDNVVLSITDPRETAAVPTGYGVAGGGASVD